MGRNRKRTGLMKSSEAHAGPRYYSKLKTGVHYVSTPMHYTRILAAKMTICTQEIEDIQIFLLNMAFISLSAVENIFLFTSE